MTERDISKVAELLAFLRPSFPPVEHQGPCYDHMGALLADVSLQAAINYEWVVLPRVRSILERFPEARCTADVVEILTRVSVEEFLEWTGSAKIARFRDLLALVAASDVETVAELRSWVSTSQGGAAVLGVHGIGHKSVDYLRLLCGAPAIPIDRHLARFLQIAGVSERPLAYGVAQELLTTSCRRLGLELTAVDRGLWLLMRSCT